MTFASVNRFSHSRPSLPKLAPGTGATPRRPGKSAAGFTLLETSVASALLATFLTSLFALNSTVMRMLRSANETAYASQELQCRVEQTRSVNWTQATSPASVQDLFSRPTDATLDLPDITETLLVRPYRCDQPEQSPAFKLQRATDGTVTPAIDGPPATGQDLSDPSVDMIRCDYSLTWRSWGGRTRTRAMSTVFSRWGVSK